MRRRWTEHEDEILREYYLRRGGWKIVRDMTGRHHSPIYRRAIYLGLHHRENRVISAKHGEKYWREPERLPMRELARGKCPGKGNGPCGRRLRREPAFAAEGHAVPGLFDLVCIAGHRFPLPAGTGKGG